jgi:MFS family permease
MFVVAGALSSVLLSANLATPLYAVYSRRFGFSSALLALVFATYALVLVPSLLAFGQVSDRFGRRPPIVAGLGTAIAGLAAFALAGGAAWLFVARVLQGLALGMLSGAATAALVELEPRGDARRAALLATLANTAGSASGPLLAGVIAEWAPAPLVLPYVAGMVLCAAAIVALRGVPEPVEAGGGGWRLQRPGVPRQIRGDFARAALTGAAVWSVAALFLSVAPSYVRDLYHSQDLAAIGATAAVLLAASCAAQLAARRGAPPAAAQAGGLGLLALGLLCIVLASPLEAPALLLAGAVLAGVGHGLAFLAAQHELNEIAPPDQRAAVNAAFYTCVYLGVALPVIGAGVLAAATSLFMGMAVFAGVIGTAALALAGWHLRHRGAERAAARAQDGSTGSMPWRRISASSSSRDGGAPPDHSRSSSRK